MKRTFWIVVGAGLGFICLIGTCVGLMQHLAERSYGVFRDVCDGKPVQLGGGRKLAAFSRNSDGTWSAENVLVPIDRLATRPEEVGAVLCLDPEKERTLETCAFQKGIGLHVLGVNVASVATGDIDRYPRVQKVLPVRILAPKTAKVLATGEIGGPMPNRCDQYGHEPSSSSFFGDPVDSEQVGAWLKQHTP